MRADTIEFGCFIPIPTIGQFLHHAVQYLLSYQSVEASSNKNMIFEKNKLGSTENFMKTMKYRLKPSFLTGIMKGKIRGAAHDTLIG